MKNFSLGVYCTMWFIDATYWFSNCFPWLKADEQNFPIIIAAVFSTIGSVISGLFWPLHLSYVFWQNILI